MPEISINMLSETKYMVERIDIIMFSSLLIKDAIL